MDSVKGAMNDVQFDDSDSDFDSPIPYTAMYVQWEANKVRKGWNNLISKKSSSITRKFDQFQQ